MQVLKFLIPSLTLVLFYGTRTGSGAVPATLAFRQSDGTQLTVAKFAEPNMAANSSFLVEFLKTATIACSTGIWRFYPQIGFNYVPGTFSGYQIGTDERERCYDISSANGSLSNMGSYRALGPINAEGQLDLDQQSITLYSGDYATGQSLSYDRASEFPITNISINTFSVGSFVLSGQHTDTGDNSDSPVFKSFQNPNTLPGEGTLCLPLVKEGGDRSKLHFRQKMEYQDGEGTIKPLIMEALMYFTYQAVQIIPGLCPDSWAVPGSGGLQGLAIFNEIKV